MKDHNFKVGDKLLCKKDYIHHKISIHKGNEYIISDSLFETEYYTFIYIIDDNNVKVEVQYEKDIYEFFYTEKEVRNIKLKKLGNEGTES